MTSRNGQSDKNQWLHKALEGKPPETKARVLEILVDYNIDAENEFFVLFTAFGYLQVLIEDSPNDWQDLFAGFQQELFAWTEMNLETLTSLRDNAHLTQEFALTSKELVKSLTTLTNISASLMNSLRKSDHTLSTSQNKLDSLNQNIETFLGEQQTFQHAVQHQIAALKPSKPTTTSKWTKWLPWGGVSVLILGCFLITWRQQAHQGSKVQWLLQKENRRDCQMRILPATHPLCQNL
jgi:hypothetical protein